LAFVFLKQDYAKTMWPVCEKNWWKCGTCATEETILLNNSFWW